MAVTVFVWHPDYFPGKSFSVGHASIHIGRLYISWFPEKHALSSALKSKARHHTMREDIIAEGRNPDFASAPLPNIDEERMVNWAKFVLGHGSAVKGPFEDISDYKLLSTSCAGLVIRALLIGTHREGGILQFLSGIVPQPLDCEIVARWMTGESLLPNWVQRFGT